MPSDTLLWSVRTFIYQQLAAAGRAPEPAALAPAFGLTLAEAEEVLRALHARHALYLEPGASRIRMANPFSAVPTPHTVGVGGLTYWANCAWDTLGLVAALHAAGAEIRSVCAATGEPVHLRVTAGVLAPASAVVHFLVPFQHWYDDLVFT